MAAEHKHLVYGKPAQTGTPVVYTDGNGKQYDAVIKQLEPVYHADLEAQIDGATRFLQHIGFNEGGAAGTWAHKEEEPAPSTRRTAAPEEATRKQQLASEEAERKQAASEEAARKSKESGKQ
jgi:hypothetical protein